MRVVASTWHVRSADPTAPYEARLELVLLGAELPESLEVLGEVLPEAELVAVAALNRPGEGAEDDEGVPADPDWSLPSGSVATVFLLRGPDEALLRHVRALDGAKILVDLGSLDPQARGLSLLVVRADLEADRLGDQPGVRVIRGARTPEEVGAVAVEPPVGPLGRVLGGDGREPDLQFDPLVEGLLDRVGRGSTLLGELAEIEIGRSLEGAVRRSEPDPPGAVPAIGPGRELGRFWIRWAGLRWAPPEGESAPPEPGGGALLVRRHRGRLLAAWSDEPFVPLEGVLRIRPRRLSEGEPAILATILNSRWASAFLTRLDPADEPELAACLGRLPLRWPSPALEARWIELVEVVDRCNATIGKTMERMASMDDLCQEAWVTPVPLREAASLFTSQRVAPVIGEGATPTRHGSEVRLGSELVLRARHEDTARLVLHFLRIQAPALVGKTGVEVERSFLVPRTDSEATILLGAVQRLEQELDDTTRRRASMEDELEDGVMHHYGLEDTDVALLEGRLPPATDRFPDAAASRASGAGSGT